MRIIGFHEVIECNSYLEERGLHFKIHIRDACGKQSFWIEPLGKCACEGKEEELLNALIGYFMKKGMELEFDEEGVNFWVKDKV